MWKFKNFFSLILLIFIADSTVAYDVYCQFDGSVPPNCPSFTMSLMTTINETANIIGVPATYIDNTTTYMQFSSTTPIKYIPTDLFHHFTYVQSFSANTAFLTEVHSNAFINCQHLMSMDLSMNPFTHLSAFFASSCFALQSLMIYQGQLTTIDENALRGLYSLQSLMMSFNQIECLPPNLFQDTRGLMMVDFGNNRIKALHSMLFKPLIQASSLSLNFMNNSITYIPDFDFDLSGYMGGGMYLSLNDNPIIAIHPLFLTHMYYNNDNTMSQQMSINFGPSSYQYTTCVDPNNPSPMGYDLHSIYGYYQWYQQNISYTYYTTCYSSFTPQMGDDSLVTCGTAITTTTSTSTTGIPTPPPTDINGNPIVCPNDRPARCYLDYLDRYTCVIKDVQGSLSSIIVGEHYQTYTNAHVQRFYFVNSALSRVPSALFQAFPNLSFLSIRNSSLGIISDQTFNQCGNLQYLDASYNDIMHIDETSLRNCTKLEVIDLTGNPLDYVSTQLYVYDPSLKTVHLHRNPDFTLG